MQASARTDIGLVRAVNEDDYLVGRRLFAVADGLGGHEAGEVASRMAVRMLEESPLGEGADPHAELRQAIERINRAIYRRSLDDRSCAGMGTTLVVLLLVHDEAYVAHVGDSRAYLLRGGKLRRLTDDHSVVGELMRKGVLSEAEAMVHPQRNLLTRAVGLQPHVEAEIRAIQIAGGDRFLLCTDGLSGAVEEDVILGVLARSQDPRPAVDELIELAKERGGHDNITALAVFIEAL